MAEQQGLHQHQRLRQHLTQQQVRFARMLEMNAPEMEEEVQKELEQNPALEATAEETVPEYTEDGVAFEESAEQLQRADYGRDEEVPYLRQPRRRGRADDPYDEPTALTPADTSVSLYDMLNAQLDESKLKGTLLTAAREIVGNLDPNGYLRRPLEGVADDLLINDGLDVSPAEMREALRAVQGLDPAGVGATDLRECLLLQLRRMPSSRERDDALRIIGEGFDAFSKRHQHQLVTLLHISAERVRKADELIRTLNPKPGAAVGTGPGEAAHAVIPDYLVEVEGPRVTVTLNNRVPELRISESFEMAKGASKSAMQRGDKGRGMEYFTRCYDDAREFMDLLMRRQKTLLRVATAIADAQRDYFLTEDVHDLKPLGIKDITAATGYDASVISRATNNKYMATPGGILPVRFFFRNSLGAGEEGESYTPGAVQDVMRKLIEGEDKRRPLSDERLRELLQREGYDVSRRTVSKYRERMRIPVARLRKSGV